ncbi:MAG: hypothetical protein IJ514_06550 [Clostridia bacterium]|nr:hypothetical protein [Clostridia bacterium]
MKKKLAVFTSALLGATVLLSATACKENTSDLLPEYSYTQATKKVAALTKDNVLSSFDGLGLCIVTTVNTEQNSTTYKLFDAIANDYVEGVEITVAASQEPAADALSYSVQTGLEKAGTGMYYTTKTTYTRTTATDDWTGIKTEYTVYGKNGKIAENVEGSFVDEIFVTKQGAHIYLNVNGALTVENNLFKGYLTYDNSAKKLDDYYVDTSASNGNYIVYDKDGKYLRSFKYANELEIPETAELKATWSIGNRLFFQYANQLPEDENDYDYVAYDYTAENVQKYDLITAYYNVKKDKVKKIDFDYVVQSEYDLQYNDELAVLTVQEIKDERLMDTALLQSFDDDGDVAVDLQELVDGATSFMPINEDMVLVGNGTTSRLYQGKKLIKEFVGLINTLQGVGKNCFYTSDQTNQLVSIYNLDGSHYKTYENASIITSHTNDLILQTETSILRFDTETKAEATVCSFEKGTAAIVSTSTSLYIELLQYGADKLPGTADDTHSIYFLIPDMEDMVNLTVENRAKINISSTIFYGNYTNDYAIYGSIFYIERALDTTTTKEYYNTYNRYDFE